MSYVKRHLCPGEQIIAATHYHWTYMLQAFLILITTWWAIGIGIVIFLDMLIRRVFTEIAITNDRLIHKRGLIWRHVDEVALDKIESVTVKQSVFGRALGYGHMVVRGVGIGEIRLPDIDRPFRFRQALIRARLNHGGRTS